MRKEKQCHEDGVSHSNVGAQRCSVRLCCDLCLNVADKLPRYEGNDVCVALGPACPVESYSTGVPNVAL